MLEFFRALFGTDFMPHLYCLRGEPGVLWLHVVSDAAIAIAYYAIPLLLFQVVLKRKDMLFRKVALLFVGFIAACGTTHVLAIWTIWYPMYRLEGVMKAATATISVATALVLVWLRPVILKMPSIAELEAEIAERRKAEEEARDKDERFRSYVEGVRDYAIFMIDLQGIIQTWNRGAERIHGYKSEEIVGRHFTCFYTPEDQAGRKSEHALELAIKTGQYEEEGWRVRQDGSRFWAEVFLRPSLDASGKLRGFTKITRDLTESRAIEAKYQVLLEATPDAIFILTPQGRIVFLNQSAEEMFGYTRVELLGKSSDVLIPAHARALQKSYRDSFFQSERTSEMGDERELWGLRKDGSEFPAESRLRTVDTADGPIALAAVRDITERKKSEMRFRNLLESAPDAMVISGGDGRIQLTNLEAERLFGYAREELVGQPVMMLIPLDLHGGYEGDSAQFFEGAGQRTMGAGIELRARRKDGTELPVEIRFSPLEGPGGTSMTAAIRDVTERKHAAQQLAEKMAELRQSNEALEQFAHIASHDLQEPLRMVASYTQLLARRYKGRLDADADDFIGFAVDGTQRMKRLIEDLLLYSRAGKGGPPMQPVQAEDAVRTAMRNLHFSIEESGAVVTYDALPTVVADESQLVQVFQNLIGNAIKYRRERIPEVHVSGKVDGQEWVFSIADNGIGIEARSFERIFVIFQRLHMRGEYEGTGVGLAICKRILQQQGGRIWVESEPGKGSIFHFALPVR